MMNRDVGKGFEGLSREGTLGLDARTSAPRLEEPDLNHGQNFEKGIHSESIHFFCPSEKRQFPNGKKSFIKYHLFTKQLLATTRTPINLARSPANKYSEPDVLFFPTGNG